MQPVKVQEHRRRIQETASHQSETLTLIDKGHGDDATRAAIVAQIEYAKR
jgi:lipase chaperone LimK